VLGDPPWRSRAGVSRATVPEHESFRLLFAANPLPMWLYDSASLQFLEVNDAAVHGYGYTRDEFLQRRVPDLHPPEDAERLHADLRRAAPGLRRWTNMRHRTRDARILDVEIAAHSLEFRGHAAVLVVVHDVTERKRAEAALLRSDARHRAIMEGALDCIITIDGDGRVIEFNPAAERTFGYRKRDVFGRPLADLIVPPDLRQAHREGVARHRATGEQRVLGRRIEMRAVRSDGSEFPVELAITKIPGDHDELYTGYLRDVTERKHSEEALRITNAQLEQRVNERTTELQAAVDELEAFSYSVSHDLRAPLRSIDGFSQALVEDVGPLLTPETRTHLTRIRNATQRMGQLIDDLLQLSKVSRGEMTREHVDLADLAGRIANDLSRRTAHSPAIAMTPPLPAMGDPRLLRILLENLLDNAWKFTSPRSDARIEIGRVDGTNGSTTFFVRDNGVGFDATYADKLFAPFQRLHAVSDFPGTGIGLATVRRIVHRHGGHVWAEGSPGGGACVSFTLEPPPPAREDTSR
jgi:PAS domain S-box-containing protein